MPGRLEPRRPDRVRRILSVIAVIAALFAAGCSDVTGPAGITGVPAGAPAVETPGLDPEGLLFATTTSSAITTKRISALFGGTVKAGRHTLFFPPGALTRDTDITLVDVTNEAGRVQAECFPEGTKFLVPVTLTSDLTGFGSPLGQTYFWVVRLPLVGETWLDVGGVPTLDGKGITTVLTHFSTYTVSARKPGY